MAIEVSVISKWKMADVRAVDVSYTCPHCGDYVTETLYFSNDIKDCIAEVNGHDCPECGESNNLDVDL